MSYATAKQISLSEIPVIDIAPLVEGESGGRGKVAEDILAAAQGVGFFYVRNHGLPPQVIADAMAASKEFFAHPHEEKMTVRINERHRGFLRVGEAKMYETAKADLKESFVWGLDVGEDDPDYLAGSPMIGPNNWPDFMPALRPVLNAFYAESLDCGRHILRACAAGLGLPEDTFDARYDKTVSRASIIYYPPQDAAMGERQFGVAPHADYGCLTLLHQDATGGLQVRTGKGEWVMALPIEGTLVVNVGDLLARWSNDRFRSNPHRVVNSSGAVRYSMAMFVDPNFDTPIIPAVDGGEPKYEPTTCGEYILSRYDESFSYRQ